MSPGDWTAQGPIGLRLGWPRWDGQFQRAGFPDDSIVECHGSIHHLQCLPETPPGHIGLAMGALAALTRIEALLDA